MKVLYSATQIAARVAELGAEITNFYQGKALHVVTIATGGIIFAADLVRQIKLPLTLDVLAVASYNHHSSTGKLTLRTELKIDPRNRDILLVDEVFDSGVTIEGLKKYFLERGAKSVHTAVMVEKQIERSPTIFLPEFIGFRAPNSYLIGYGMDSDEQYRQLPDIEVVD